VSQVAFVGLGSNLGDRDVSIRRAIEGMALLPGTTVERVSSLYETLPWGGVAQGAFLNAVVQLRTSLAPDMLLSELLALEDKLGRTRVVRWGPRVIDLDLLLYDDLELYTDTLQVPHPRLTERAFALVPLAEIAPDVVIGSRSAKEHLDAMSSQRTAGDVVKWREWASEDAGSAGS
jgi:2-amino-4-hydroxy-6-hydroxymethyldihydropteridine diphosphokinase